MKNTRPFTTLLEVYMTTHRLDAAGLAVVLKNVVSKPTVYNLLMGATPSKAKFQSISEALGFNKDVAESAYVEQKALDKKLRAKPTEPDFELTPWEKRTIKKIRTLSSRGKAAFIYFLERAAKDIDSKNEESKSESE